MFWKNRSWGLAGLLVGLLAAAPADAGDWTEVQLRGGLDLVELVLPIFGADGAVQRGPAMNFALAWRQLDPGELMEDPEADGLKPLGIFAGVSFNVADPFDFHWVQVQGGFTYEETVQGGLGIWVGNATETGEDPETGETLSWRVPGLDMRAKMLLGVGVEANP